MLFDRQYMTLCSEKTLQSNKEGFFLDFAQNLAKTLGENWIKKFGKLKTDRDRIHAIYEDPEIKDYTNAFLSNVREVFRKKCPQTAKKHLLEAQKCLEGKEMQKALNLFSQSILKAPKSDILSLALVGRAKALISLGHVPEALTDLKSSLRENLPGGLKGDAFWLMHLCHKAMGQESQAKIALNLAEKLTNRREINHVAEPITRHEAHVPPIVSEHKIQIMHSREMGRFAAAEAPIKAGETLVVEQAAVACLFPEKFGTHCQLCMARVVSPVGCLTCCSVVFCSPECRQMALFHGFECKFLDLLIGSGMSVLTLAALRAITQKQAKVDRYTLCTNGEKRPAGDFFQRALMAAFLLRCLQKSGYFPARQDSVLPTQEEYHIGEMLLHYLQVLQFNAHEIFETVYTKEHELKGGKTVYIGVGIYPTVSLFNHDCYPSVTRYFVGSRIVIRATRALAAGVPISENYGPVFTHRSLLERQRALSARYWFKCQCKACVEDWPTLKTGQFVKRVRCPKCQRLFNVDAGKCDKCDVSLVEQIEKLLDVEQRYKQAVKLMDEKRVKEAVDVLCDALDEFHRLSAAPHEETHRAEEALRFCLLHFGNTYDSLVAKQ